jgi:hypothetical protein
MSQDIVLDTRWCDEHWGKCYFAFHEETATWQHIGSFSDMATFIAKMKTEFGFQCKQRSGIYTLYRRKSQPLTLPLDWQMAQNADQEREPIDPAQDW